MPRKEPGGVYGGITGGNDADVSRAEDMPGASLGLRNEQCEVLASSVASLS
jgi:hypothetical protein